LEDDVYISILTFEDNLQKSPTKKATRILKLLLVLVCLVIIGFVGMPIRRIM